MVSIHTEMELRRNKDSAWDPQVFADRAKRAKRLAKSKRMLKPAIQRAVKKSLAEAPIRPKSGQLEKQLKRVQLMRTRGRTIIYGVRVDHSPFYAGWRRVAMNKELVPWTPELAEEVTEILYQYITHGRD